MTTELLDDTKVARLAAQIASQNPCCTNAEIMEMVAEAVADDIKARCIPEDTDG